MSANQQVKILADYIMMEIPGAPSGDDGGAGDTAIRLLKQYRRGFTEIMSELGVPGEGYPMPAANAYEIAKRELGEME